MNGGPSDSFESSEPDPIDAFDGVTRLFPLPNVVLFPGALLPLHIFEPRYRELVADAMESDRLITMVLLKPGYEEDYEACPPIHEVGCLGRIMQHEPLPDGRSNLILHGLRRVHIDSEPPSDRLYRTARATILEDRYPPDGPGELAELCRRVLKLLTDMVDAAGEPAEAERIAQANDLPAGTLCDIACSSLGFDVTAKQALLEELNVKRRAEALLAWMKAWVETSRRRRDHDSSALDFSPN